MGFKYLFIYFSSWLCCPLRLQDLPQTCGESVSWCLETSFFFKTPFLGQISVPASFVSLFIFYIFSYLLLKTMGCFSGCLVFSASIQKLFCGICSAFKCSFSEFVGKKVISPSYFSAILGLPRICCLGCFSRISCCNKLGEENLKHGLEPLKFGFILMLETTL